MKQRIKFEVCCDFDEFMKHYDTVNTKEHNTHYISDEEKNSISEFVNSIMKINMSVTNVDVVIEKEKTETRTYYDKSSKMGSLCSLGFRRKEEKE